MLARNCCLWDVMVVEVALLICGVDSGSSFCKREGVRCFLLFVLVVMVTVVVVVL